MADIQKPKVLFIDWNKTLSNSFFWSQLADKNHPHNNYHQIISHWLFEKNNHLIDQWMRGAFTAEEICRLIATENHLDQKIVFDTLRDSCFKMELCSPDIIDLVKNIQKQGIKVIVATDNMDTFKRFTIPGMGLNKVFDDFLISYDLKTLKYDNTDNDIPFFEKFLKKNNLFYKDVVLLDDSRNKSGIYDKLGFKISLVENAHDLIEYLREYL